MLVEVEHVKAHHTENEKTKMSHFEKFVTEGNEKADELAKEGAMWDSGFLAQARASTIQQERGQEEEEEEEDKGKKGQGQGQAQGQGQGTREKGKGEQGTGKEEEERCKKKKMRRKRRKRRKMKKRRKRKKCTPAVFTAWWRSGKTVKNGKIVKNSSRSGDWTGKEKLCYGAGSVLVMRDREWGPN